jgi:hypothetical protein
LKKCIFQRLISSISQKSDFRAFSAAVRGSSAEQHFEILKTDFDGYLWDLQYAPKKKYATLQHCSG